MWTTAGATVTHVGAVRYWPQINVIQPVMEVHDRHEGVLGRSRVTIIGHNQTEPIMKCTSRFKIVLFCSPFIIFSQDCMIQQTFDLLNTLHVSVIWLRKNPIIHRQGPLDRVRVCGGVISHMSWGISTWIVAHTRWGLKGISFTAHAD
jgi:hypothetical protein